MSDCGGFEECWMIIDFLTTGDLLKMTGFLPPGLFIITCRGARGAADFRDGLLYPLPAADFPTTLGALLVDRAAVLPLPRPRVRHIT